MTITVLQGDCLAVLPTLPAESINCTVTSPPYYGLRDYDVPPTDWPAVGYSPMPGLPVVTVPAMSCCLGLEPDPIAYVGHLLLVFREVWRVMRDDGVCWLNLGDSYASGEIGRHDGISQSLEGMTKKFKGNNRQQIPLKSGVKQKNLLGIPWRVAFALQADGWTLRQDVIWAKANPMPESVKDRCTKAHEYVFLLVNSSRYWWDAAAIAEPSNCPEGPGNKLRHRYAKASLDGDVRMKTHGGLLAIGARETRNLRSVWTLASQPFTDAHFATMPAALAERCIKATCPPGGAVLDPFGGAGTTGLVADRLQRDAVLIELNPDYASMAGNRIRDDAPLFAEVADG